MARFRSAKIVTLEIERVVSRTLLQGLLRDSWPMVLVSIFLGLSYSLDPLVINFAMGPGAVAEYALAAKITQITSLVFVSAFPILWTHFARASSIDSAVVFRLSVLFGFAGLAVASVLFLLGHGSPNSGRRAPLFLLTISSSPLRPGLAFSPFRFLSLAHRPTRSPCIFRR